LSCLEITFSQSFSGDLFAVAPAMFAFARLKSNVTMFRDNSYLDRLNRTLQSELLAISTYNGVSPRNQKRKQLEPTQEAHKEAGKLLVNLIVSNQGIPDEDAALGVGFTTKVVGVCSAIPSKMFERATFSTLSRIEKGLVHNYDKLLEDAPARDIAMLKHLRDSTKLHLTDLDNIS